MQVANDQIKQILANTLSPNVEIRRNAENQLLEASKRPGHPIEVLKFIAGATPSEVHLSQAGAIHFKNIIKKGWDVASEDGTHGIEISEEHRNIIKTHLVELMCTAPQQIQAQISEAISLIAVVDYPAKWENLLPELIRQFRNVDQSVVNGVLKTANSIFKRFRHVGRSDELYRIIIYTLQVIQEPLLILFTETNTAIDALGNDAAQLLPRLETLRLICRIFYSLNYQDLPEYFEDHMQEWMAGFAKYLQYSNKLATDDSEELEPSPLDKLQAAIVENLSLYADKDEEPFLPFLSEFTTLVWNLLLTVTSYPKHDVLCTTSIRFLSHLVQKLMHKDLFAGEETLRQIVSKIVIPNLMVRESDEERFEDDPREYILTEIEGSDSESRRKCSEVLLRDMCRHFETQTTAICLDHIKSMLAEFAADPTNKWVCKDAAIHLMFGISIRRESSLGVAETNEAVNVMDFFNQFILPELQDSNHNSRPVVKAAALKFVGTFRNQFSKEQLLALLPLLINHLGSPSVVVHTFAAHVIERLLMAKEEFNNARRSKISSADLLPHLERLFTALFMIVDNPEWNENDYVMKCVMRSLSTADENVIPVTQIVVEKLTAALGVVAKNPRNPQFNHYLFESIAVLIKSVCSKEPSAATNFEGLLFPPFQLILQMEIVEFTPYVFQVLSQLLEYRPAELGLGEAYSGLFPPLLTPALWEKKGNVPAITRLLQAYLYKAASEVATQNLMGILGVFQKLLALPSTEMNAFDLLSTVTLYVAQDLIQSHFATIFKLILTKLTNAKHAKSGGRTNRLSSQYFALFIAKYGSQAYMDVLNSIQAGIAVSLIGQVWLPSLKSDPPSPADAKIQVIGLTKLLCDTPALLSTGDGQLLWSNTLQGLLTLLTSSSFGNEKGDDLIDVEIGYDATYSGLIHAKKKMVDPFQDIRDPIQMFVQSLHALVKSNPQQVMPIIQGLGSQPELSAGLQSMFQSQGLSLS